MMSRRILLSIFLLTLVVATPYWVYLPAIALSIFFIPFYLEGVLLALIVDTLYGSGDSSFFLFDFPLSIVATILLLVVPVVQRRLRFHS